jgi:guanylate kinase
MIRKAIIVSAPSGAGKSTIVQHLMKELPQLAFSVSACSRNKRESETDGVHYYFISADEFRKKIVTQEFVEWEEVYPGSYYGTLKSELERIWNLGKFPVFDVDVVGGLNLKKYFGDDALALFIQPPSEEELEVRLRNRNTESEESLLKRLGKAKQELSTAGQFDRIVVNDDLDVACGEALQIVKNFLKDTINHKDHKG